MGLLRPRLEVMRWFRGIGFKLALAILLLVLLLTCGLSVPIMRVMDDFLLQELVKRGHSVAQSAATPAAFSILADDRLALDNLAVKVAESQADIGYLAIVGSLGTILAHNQTEFIGRPFEGLAGTPVVNAEAHQVQKVEREGVLFFEFRTPIEFAGKKIGDIHLGVEAATLEASRQQARRTIVTVGAVVIALGLAATLFLSTLITAPVKRLASGVARLKAGEETPTIQVVSGDELGRLTRDFNEMARTISGQKHSLRQHARDLEDSYTSMVRILAASIEARDVYTLGHSTRVANLSVLIGQKLGLEASQLKDLALSCFLHDLGKIRVPDSILKKAGPLNPEEVRAIRLHPEHGAEILQLSGNLQRHIPAVLHHHEWYNGQGYPMGLKGQEIPLAAAILTLADTYDALTSCRPYRPGRSREEAVQEIRRYRGIQFAPDLTDRLLEALPEYAPEESTLSWHLAV
jgi:HD-GYP domain-containing protein (c-di-GMP phosphodiesterase class II)